jgi:prephenate dehydratase
MRIAIQGATGSFHHQAANTFDNDVEVLSCNTFRDVFDAVDRETVEFGLVAIENNLHGSINEVYRLLERREVWIVNDLSMRIEQHLIGHDSVTVEELAGDPNTRIFSQGPALAQVELWLDEHLPTAHREETHDTALAVQTVMENANTHAVAVAGEFAARTYHGNIIASNIQDDPDNFTRFILFQKKRVEMPNATHASIILKTDHAAGSLLRALQVFAECEANLTKLDSHPIPGDERHYAFYIDYELPAQQAELLAALEAQGSEVKLLGEYISRSL